MNDRIPALLRFGDDIIDCSEVVALVGYTVFLRDGRTASVGTATADALRAAVPPARALPECPECPESPEAAR